MGADSSIKLVPRPIPGLSGTPAAETVKGVLMPSFASSEGARSSPSQLAARRVNPGPSVASAANEAARILFVHRRDRLPPAMNQRLEKFPVEPSPAAAPPPSARLPVEERSGAVRIIPKSDVRRLTTPAPPTQP